MRTVVQDFNSSYLTNHDVPKFTLETNVDVPNPDKYEVVVQVKACGLSVIKQKVLSEVFKKNPPNKCIVGQDVAGVIVKVGSAVTNVKLDDAVAGCVPLDSQYSGCGEYCLMSEYDVVKKPDKLSFEEAAAVVGDCVKAYTALYYQARLCGGDTVLVMDGATPSGSACLQLASHWGAKVITTASSQDERGFIESLHLPVAQVIDLSHRGNLLLSCVMEETGGIGVDVLVDNGVKMFSNEEDNKFIDEKSKYPLPHKHDVISCLGMSGKWITSQSDLQLDPPDSQKLFLRGGSVNFLFAQVWALSYAQHGRYQHILQDAMDKLEKGIIRCKIAKTVTLDGAVDALKTLEDIRIGKVVVQI